MPDTITTADQNDRPERREQLRLDALAAKSKAVGTEAAQYADLSAADLEQLSYAKQDAPKPERQAIRVALDRALARESADKKLTPEERSVIVEVETLRAKGSART